MSQNKVDSHGTAQRSAASQVNNASNHQFETSHTKLQHKNIFTPHTAQIVLASFLTSKRKE